MTRQRFGLSCALATPFTPDGGADPARLAAHSRTRLSAGCSSVTLFGTTGEGASLGPASREAMLQAVHAAGIDLAREVVVGIAATSVEEALAQAAQAASFGCRTLLLPPPFYFKEATDEGLLRWFGRVLERVAADGQRAILYHIPPVTAVPLGIELVGKLKQRFPGTVQGVKDSSGEWECARALLAAHGELTILIGDERLLAQAVRLGASGAISGLANVIPELLLPLANEGREDPRVNALVDELVRYPVIPAVKELVAHRTRDAAWRAVAPPLEPLAAEQARRLREAFDGIVARSLA
jgi:4-hydroxy-tetrahydrodipicolinate synthase